MADFESLAVSLRRRAERRGDAFGRAATELLIGHEIWLRDDDFRQACIKRNEGEEFIAWHSARDFISFARKSSFYSSSALTMLRLAIMLALDDHNLSNLDRTNRRLVAGMLATGLGVKMEADGSLPRPRPAQ